MVDKLKKIILLGIYCLAFECVIGNKFFVLDFMANYNWAIKKACVSDFVPANSSDFIDCAAVHSL